MIPFVFQTLFPNFAEQRTNKIYLIMKTKLILLGICLSCAIHAQTVYHDAEKFLRVTFELFEGICLTAAPTRANLDVTIGLYISQLKSIYSSYERAMHRKYESSDGEKNSSTASEYIARILEWVSTTDTFGIIDSLHPMTDDGDLQYNRLDDPREWKKQFDSFGI